MDFPGKPGLQGGGHGRADQSCVTVAPVPCAPHGHGCALMGWTPAVPGRAGNVGWAGTCVLLPLLVAAPWLHLEGPGSISSPDSAWCRPALPALLALISPNSWQPGIFPH